MNEPRVNADKPSLTLLEVLSHLENALSSLDKLDAPAEVGAHLDLAIERLRASIDRQP